MPLPPSCTSYHTTIFNGQPPSKGLTTPASLWDSRTAVQRLPLCRAKIVFDVPRRRGGLGTPALALVCCGDAFSQLHPRCNRFYTHLGGCRCSHPHWSLPPGGGYPNQLLHLRSAADLRSAARPPAKSSAFCLFIRRHRGSFPCGTGSIFA